MKFKKGICDECRDHCENLGISPPERFIVNKSRNLCGYHDKLRRNDAKALPEKKKKFLQKAFRKPTGEAELFKEIWEALEPEQRVSFVTGFPLPDQHEMRTYYFSHVLSKGSRPELRLVKKNIVLMTLQEHKMWETEKHKIKADPKLMRTWQHVFDLAEELKIFKSN